MQKIHFSGITRTSGTKKNGDAFDIMFLHYITQVQPKEQGKIKTEGLGYETHQKFIDEELYFLIKGLKPKGLSTAYIDTGMDLNNPDRVIITDFKLESNKIGA